MGRIVIEMRLFTYSQHYALDRVHIHGSLCYIRLIFCIAMYISRTGHEIHYQGLHMDV